MQELPDVGWFDPCSRSTLPDGFVLKDVAIVVYKGFRF